jgi:fucose permease
MGLNPAVLYRFQTSGASLLNLLNAIFGLGAILSPVLFVWLGRSVPFVYSALAMAALVLIFLSRGLDDRVPAAIPDRAFIPEPGNVHWSVFVALLLIAIAIGVEACLVWWGPTLLVSNGLSEHAAALHLSAFFFAFVIMRFVGIAIAQIWSPMSVLQFVLPALTAFLVVAQLSPDHSRVMYVCCGALSAALFPNLFVLYTEQLILSVPSTPMILGSAIIGSITMPLFSGLWVDFIGLSSLFAFFAFAVASATLCLVALRVAWVTRDPVR